MGAPANEYRPAPPHAILCVTNDRLFPDFFVRALPGYEVVMAASGYEGLRAVNARAFEAYLLDFWFPDWNGVGLCRAIREIDPHGPIVFCSSPVTEMQKARAFRAGADAYLIRPVEPAALRSRIAALLENADRASRDARNAEERAIQDELDRRLASALDRVSAANQLFDASMERTAKARALRAFLEARGARSHFDRWWPQAFSTARASRLS